VVNDSSSDAEAGVACKGTLHRAATVFNCRATRRPPSCVTWQKYRRPGLKPAPLTTSTKPCPAATPPLPASDSTLLLAPKCTAKMCKMLQFHTAFTMQDMIGTHKSRVAGTLGSAATS
jgi:hypothetical protein